VDDDSYDTAGRDDVLGTGQSELFIDARGIESRWAERIRLSVSGPGRRMYVAAGSSDLCDYRFWGSLVTPISEGALR